MDYYEVFNKIKRLAKNNGWNITKLAEKAGIARSTIYNIKNCENDISVRTAQSIAKALDCPVSRFMTLDEKQKKIYDPPKPKQFVLTIWGDFTIKPQTGHCCIVTTSYQLPPEELEAQVKIYLFDSKDVDASMLQAVRSYAQELAVSRKATEAEKTGQ